jgi:ribosomal protein L29
VSKLSDRRKEIREYTTDQADQELQRLRRQLFDLRIQQQRGEVKNNRQFTQVRTDIARLMYQLDLLALAEAEEAEEELLEEEEEAEEAAAEAEEEAEEETAEEEEAQEEEAEEEEGAEEEEEEEAEEETAEEEEEETASEAEEPDTKGPAKKEKA